jgi:hypothetical protein
MATPLLRRYWAIIKTTRERYILNVQKQEALKRATACKIKDGENRIL